MITVRERVMRRLDRAYVDHEVADILELLADEVDALWREREQDGPDPAAEMAGIARVIEKAVE